MALPILDEPQLSIEGLNTTEKLMGQLALVDYLSWDTVSALKWVYILHQTQTKN